MVDDIWFYIYHRTLHAYAGPYLCVSSAFTRTIYQRRRCVDVRRGVPSVPVLYKSIHKPHHVFTAPFAATSHATHPLEMMLQGVGGMLGPLLIGCTLTEFWVWLAVRQWQGMEDHTGPCARLHARVANTCEGGLCRSRPRPCLISVYVVYMVVLVAGRACRLRAVAAVLLCVARVRRHTLPRLAPQPQQRQLCVVLLVHRRYLWHRCWPGAVIICVRQPWRNAASR